MKSSTEKYYALLPLLLCCTCIIFKAATFEIHDFANYYFGGYFLGNGEFDPGIYFPYRFNQMIASLGHTPGFAGFAPNTPFLALLFYPLTFLPPMTAKLAFNIVSAVLFLASVKRLAGFYQINPVYILCIPLVFFVPLKNELFFGQVYLLLFFFLTESWLAHEKKQHIKTGIFLGLAIMLKVFPALLALALLFGKRYRAFGWTILSGNVLFLLTLPFCGIETWIFYISDVLPKASDGGIASAYVENYQSVFMFLKRLLVFEATENPDGLFENRLLFAATLLAFKVFVLATGFYLTKKTTAPLWGISYWVLAIILISPYGSTYTFILMLFPFFAIAKLEIPLLKKTILLALLLGINNIPIGVFFRNPFPLSYLRLFALLLFFGLVLSLVYQNIRWKMVSGIAVAALLLALMLKKREKPSAAYFLPPDAPLLVYDYEIRNNRLTYYFWNQLGKNSQSMTLKTSRVESADLTQNAIYYFGKKIPADTGNKLKPMVIDGKTLLYLSDYDRGIGFYTLRKIDL